MHAVLFDPSPAYSRRVALRASLRMAMEWRLDVVSLEKVDALGGNAGEGRSGRVATLVHRESDALRDDARLRTVVLIFGRLAAWGIGYLAALYKVVRPSAPAETNKSDWAIRLVSWGGVYG